MLESIRNCETISSGQEVAYYLIYWIVVFIILYFIHRQGRK